MSVPGHAPAPRPLLPLAETECSSQADLEAKEASFIAMLMAMLFNGCGPSVRPAAIKGGVTPGFITVMRKFGSDPAARVRSSSPTFLAVEGSLDNLCHIMQHEKENPTGLWKPAYDAGIVPAICAVLTHGSRDQMIVNNIITLILRLVKPAPRKKDARWVRTLPRAVAGLVIAQPPVIPVRAVNCLGTLCALHPDLYREFDSWGLRRALKRLSNHRDPETARTALGFLLVSGSEQVAAVSPCYLTPFCFPRLQMRSN